MSIPLGSCSRSGSIKTASLALTAMEVSPAPYELTCVWTAESSPESWSSKWTIVGSGPAAGILSSLTLAEGRSIEVWT